MFVNAGVFPIIADINSVKDDVDSVTRRHYRCSINLSRFVRSRDDVVSTIEKFTSMFDNNNFPSILGAFALFWRIFLPF